MKYLLDTDHVSVLQQQSGADFLILSSRIAELPPDDFGIALVTFHEQVMGCHTYITRAVKTPDLIRGYAMLERLRSDYVHANVLPFDAAASVVFDDLRSRNVRIGSMDLRIAAIALWRIDLIDPKST